jgi:hypothetical protein
MSKYGLVLPRPVQQQYPRKGPHPAAFKGLSSQKKQRSAKNRPTAMKTTPVCGDSMHDIAGQRLKYATYLPIADHMAENTESES